MSTGWTQVAFSGYNIKQVEETTIGGVTFDTDTASSILDIGAW